MVARGGFMFTQAHPPPASASRTAAADVAARVAAVQAASGATRRHTGSVSDGGCTGDGAQSVSYGSDPAKTVDS